MTLSRCRQVYGRDAEQAVLRRGMERLRQGHGSFVLVTGPAGIGKSRLAAEVLDAAERAGLATALGRATAGESSVPYRPLTQALLQSIRRAGMPDDPDFAAWRVALQPVLNGGQGGTALAPDVAVRGEAVAQLLSRTAPEGAVVVIDDLHWADPDTVAVLDVLADGVAALPVLWLVTARAAGQVDELADRLRGRRGVTALTLEPLPPSAVAQMVAECRPDADGALLEHVHRVAEGVPLFVEEIAAARGVPDSFARAVSAQLDSLDAVTRRIVEAAAVIGELDNPLLPVVADCDGAELALATKRAVDVGLLVGNRTVARFRHALTREAVLETLGTRRREIAAAALSAAGADAGELAAELAEQSGDQVRAGLLLAAAGERAAQQGGLPTAVTTLRRAVRLLAGHPERESVRLRLVDVLSSAGHVEDALAEAAVVLAAEPSPAVHLALAEVAAHGARWTLAADHLAHTPPGERRDVLDAEIAFAAGRTADARAAALRAGDAADPDLRCRAAILLGRIDRLTDLGSARTAFERALATARAAQLPVRELDALHELGTIDMLDHGGTGKLLDARATAERLGAIGTRAVLDLQLMAAYLGHFEPATAERHAAAAADTADRLGLAAAAGKARCGLAEVCAQRLDRDGMERRLAEATAVDPVDVFTQAFGWGQCRGMLALFRGNLDEALTCFERGVVLLAEAPNPEPVEFRALWPLLLAAVGDSRAAVELAAANVSDLTITFANRGLLGYAGAILAGGAGDHSAAADLALRADAYFVRFPVWGHLARWAAADAAARDGWGRPAAWLAAAEPAFTALGFDALAGRCRSRRHAAVTAREEQVLALVGEGLANKQIALRLQLSTRTVEKHVESLLRKTGSRSRTQLAVWADRQTT